MYNDGVFGEVTPSCQLSLYAGAAMLFTLVVWKFCRRQRRYEVPARDVSKGHHWYTIDILSHTAYCGVCSSLIVDGWYCDSCGTCSDNSCISIADKNIFCKSLSGTAGISMKHHWIRGNLSHGSECDVCNEACGLENALSDFRCCWCQRSVHTKCQASLSDICDLGRFRSCIVPPYCVKLKLVGWKGRRHLVVGEVKAPAYKPWFPLVVIANRQSGNNEGGNILRAFRGILNPAQVIDLHDLPPESGLEWCHLIPKHTCKVLVAGGDGTVGWVLSAIEKLRLEPAPEVCIIPLGTGNDLARVLGWGEGYSGDVDVIHILSQLVAAQPVKLDRWRIKITHNRHLGIRKPSKIVYMSNYASVGVDALVALNFHKTRQSKFYLFSSRLLNKFLYLGYGTKEFLERQCKNLDQKVSLWVDGQQVALQEVEALVVLNIPSWGAGVRPWHMGALGHMQPMQRYDDGILEIIGLYSAFHIAQLQIGLSEPIRLGQGREVIIRLKECLPIQVDGEPWEQSPCELKITYFGQSTLLKCSAPDN